MNTDELMVEAINLARKNLIEWQEYGEALKNQLDAANAKLSERKTVHEWLNAKGTPREENGKPLCLLRRLAIALGIHDGLKVRLIAVASHDLFSLFCNRQQPPNHGKM